MQTITYKEYTMIATAFKNDQDKWIGQVEFRAKKDNPVDIQNPMLFDNEQFNTKQEAEDFALDGAQFFIDTQLKDSGLE
jgi:hypothetical protein